MPLLHRTNTDRLQHGSFVNLHWIPLREKDISLASTVPFHDIERRYFCDVRTFTCHDDMIKQRNEWLNRIGFCQAQNYPLPETPAQSQLLNELYSNLHIFQRKAIFSHAKFLKLLARPPSPSWQEFENKYEIYPAAGFTCRAEYKSKR